MIQSKRFGIFSICLLLTVIAISEASDSTENETVSKIIQYFNENPNSPYIYKEGQYVNSQIKADILQVAINVNVTCKIIHPEVPCENTTLACVAFLRLKSSQNKSHILSGSCHIEDTSVEQSNKVLSRPQPEEISQNFDLSHEAVYSEHNADFIAVKKNTAPCVGCPFDMSLDVEGIWTLIDTALKHVEQEYSQKYALVKVLRLQQQIVSGVKYILLLEIAPTVCPKVNNPELCHIDNTKEPAICEVVYLEKPWLSDAKNIIKNNCTISQEYNVEGKPKKISSNDRRKEISDDFLLEIESQIIPTTQKTSNVGISLTQPQIQQKNNEILEPVIKPTQSLLTGPSYSLVTEESPNIGEKDIFQRPSDVSPQFGGTATVEQRILHSPLDGSTSGKLDHEKANTLTENIDEYTVINLSRKRRHIKCKNDESNNDSDVASNESSSSENSSDDDSNNISKNFKRSGEKSRESHKGHHNVNKSEQKNRKKIDISSPEINDRKSHDSSSSTSSSSSSSSSSDSNSSSMKSKDIIKHKSNCKFTRKDDYSSSPSSSDGNSDQESRKKERYASDRSDESSSRSNECDEDVTNPNQETDKREPEGSTSSSDNSIETKEENSSSGQDDKNSKKKRDEITHESNSLSDEASDSDCNDSKSNKRRIIHKRTKNKSTKSPESSENKSEDSASNNNLNSRSDDDSNSERESNSDDRSEGAFKKGRKNKYVENSDGSSNDDNSHSTDDSNSDESNDDSDMHSNSNSDTDESKDSKDSKSVFEKGVSVKRSENCNSDSDESKDQSDSNSRSDSNNKKEERVKRYDTQSNSDSIHNSGIFELNKHPLSGIKTETVNNNLSDDFDKKRIKRLNDSHMSKSDSSSDSNSDENKEFHSKSSKSSKSSESSESHASNDSKKSRENRAPVPFNSETNNKSATKFINNQLTNEIDEQPLVTLNRRKRSLPTLEDFSEHEKQEIKKLAKVAGKILGAKKSKIHIMSVKKLKMDDVYYRMKLKFENKSCIIVMSIIDKSDIKLLKSKCKDESSTQSQNNTKDIKQYIYNGLAFLDSQSSHSNKYKMQQIVESSTQFTSADMFRITAKVILSECTKESKLPPEDCKELENARSKICHFIISGNKDGMNITCEDEPKIDTTRVKRDTSLPEDNSDNIDFVNQQLFGNFMETYSKKYQNKIEFYYRFKVFKDNLNTIRLLNKFEQGSATYGITGFTDLTREEFSKRHGLRWDLQSENNIPFPQAEIPNVTLPTEFDWRKKNAVTEVKDQGSCGSCWAFSTTGNIEGQYAIKYNKLLEFSEQELVDCDNLDDGCNGGLMDNAYRAIEKLGGLETENDYPYDAEGEKCKFTKNKVKVQLSGALNISHDETDMAKWLVQNGPISIAINANAMQFYVGGVSHPWKLLCNPKNLDHGVLIVGFGVHTYPRFNKTLPFWIVKNSWGPSWGEQGYYRVYRGDGTCGLNQTPSSAIVA